jgi:hypothetical protein
MAAAQPPNGLELEDYLAPRDQLARNLNKEHRREKWSLRWRCTVAHMPRFQIGSQTRLTSDIEELGRKVNALPEPHRQQLTTLYDRVVENFRLRTRIMNVAKEALERMRLEVACLQFDLDMTRREKESLQDDLDDDAPPPASSHS